MKTRLHHIILLLAAAVAAVSCSDRGGGGLTPEDPSADELKLRISLDAGPAPSRADTPEATDCDIRDVLVLLFTETAAGNNTPGTLWRALEARNLGGENGEARRWFDVSFGIDPATVPARLVAVAVANAADRLDDIRPGVATGWTYADVVRTLVTDLDTRLEDASRPVPLFTMWGKADRTLDTSLQTQTLHMTLVRDMARVDVSLAEGLNFAIAHALIYNRNGNIALVPGLDRLGADGHTIALPSLGPDANITECESYTALPYESALAKTSFYTAEQDLLMGGDGDPADSHRFERPALIVGGYYGTNHQKIYWYRVDFRDAAGKILDILRNHAYGVNVKAVNGPGEDTPGEAYRSLTTHVSAEIAVWEDISLDAEFDGPNWLAMPRSVTLGPGADAEGALSFMTNVAPDTWEAAWGAPGADWESLEYKPCAGTLTSADFSATFPAATEADGSAQLAFKALTALPDETESRSAMLYIKVTPRLRVAVSVVQTRTDAGGMHGPWGEENVFGEI